MVRTCKNNNKSEKNEMKQKRLGNVIQLKKHFK